MTKSITNVFHSIGLKGINNLLCMCLLGLILNPASAQTVITIGTGTTTPTVGTNPGSGANGASPYGYCTTSGAMGKKLQIIYTPAQINAAMTTAGYGGGASVISTVAWDISNQIGTGNGPHNNYTIKMANVAQTNFVSAATPYTGSSTTVWGPTNITFPTGTGYTQTFTLITPFTWDGTSSLLVEVCYTASTPGSIGSYGGCRRTLTTGNNQMIYNGGAAINCATSTYPTVVAAIPNMRLTVAAACTAPTTQAVAQAFSLLTTNSVQVNWTRGNGDAGVVVVAHAATAVSANPASGTNYTVGQNAAFGSGTNLGSNNYVVYAGTGTSVNVTGLTPGTTYHFAVFEYNAATPITCYKAPGATSNQLIPVCFPPTMAASGINFSNVLTTSNDVNWTRGDGDAGVIVVARLSTSTNTAPTMGAAYTANASFGSGSQLGTGNYVVYQGAGTTVNVTNLLPSTNYVYSVYEYNATGLCYGSPGSGNQTTASCSPSAQPTSLIVPCVDYTTMTLSFNRGNGTHTIVLARAGSAVNADPAYNTSYTANTVYGSGSQIGTGNFVVYNGNNPGSVSVSLTGLTPGVTYHFKAYEYNAAPDCYNYVAAPTVNKATRLAGNYTSSTTTQNTSTVIQNSLAQQIIGLQVVVGGGVDPAATMNSITFNTTGTTNTATDLINAKIFYTGTSSTYSNATQFGSTFTSFAGNLTANGNFALLPGTNYFWVAYDVNVAATVSNVLDATIVSFNLTDNTGASNKTPSVTAPAGSRAVVAPGPSGYCIPSPATEAVGDYTSAPTWSGGDLSVPLTYGGGNSTGSGVHNQTAQPGPTLTPGVTYTLSYYADDFIGNTNSVWIDWDQSGTWSTSGVELVRNSGASFSVSQSVTVPLTATPGATRMRIINRFPTAGTNACVTSNGSSTSGVYVDYTVNVSGGTGGVQAISCSTLVPAITTPVNYAFNATAIPLTATGTTLLWYTAASGGTGSSTAPTPLTNASGTTAYYVSQTNTSGSPICEGPRTQIAVVVGTQSCGTPPAITTCGSSTPQGNDVGQCGAIVNYASATASGVPAPIITYSQNSGTVFPVGTTTVTATATNASGTATCQFSVVVNDTEAPVANVTPLADVTGECSATATAPTATDNCAGTITATTLDPTSYSTQGNFVIHWSYNDGNGNIAIQNQNVIIDDVTNPVPDNADLPIITGECSATATAPTATDNCAGTITATTLDPTSYSTQGSFVIHWSYDDGAGNVVTQNQNVVIDDVTNPVPSLAVLPDIISECSATATAPTATDNCAGTITATTLDPTSYSTQGSFVIHWSYDDGAGNVVTQNQNVIIDDVTNPVISNCPNSITSCNPVVTWTAPTASDNCGTPLLTSNFAPGAIFPVGTTTVTYTADDGNGNTAICSFSVTINSSSVEATSATSDSPFNTICTGGSTNLSFSGGSLGTGAIWNWYSGSCGGTLAGTGLSISVSPTVNTTYFVRAEGTCNNTICASVTITVSTAPVTSLALMPFTGMPANLCNGTVATLSVAPVNNATFYVWDAPTGSYFNGNPLNVSPFTTATPSVTITFGNPSGSLYNIGVQAGNACGSSIRQGQKVRGLTSVPTNISGVLTTCANTSGSYSTPSVTGASSYLWTITGNATVTGTGTTVTVNFGAGWMGGTLCVAAQTSCYTSPTKCITINNTAATLGAISGTFTACPNSVLTYSVPASAGAASYAWTAPPGSSVTAGQGTNSVSVTYSPSYSASGNICVNLTSICGVTSANKCKTVAPGLPAQPSSISGPGSGLCNQTVVFNCPSQGAGTTYNWTVPAGATINSGQSSTAINVTFGTLTTGSICVVAHNACGNSISRCITVKGAPATPGAITAIPGSWCANEVGIEFDVNVAGLTGIYTLSWVYPTAPVATYLLGGGNSTSLLMDWGTGSGNINVKASNACGSGTKTSVWGSSCREGEVTTVSTLSIVPNPTTGLINVSFTAIKGNTVINVLDLAGRVIMTRNAISVEGSNTIQLDMSKLAKGAYMLNVKSAQGNKQAKIVVE